MDPAIREELDAYVAHRREEIGSGDHDADWKDLTMRTHAQAVVIGGGLVGCSILYHLAKLGWTDRCCWNATN